MSNPTSNYAFVMPTPTDLVTDLPADFEVFGQAVDTQMKTNADAATQKATLTTKGDLYAASAASTPARLAVGTNGQVLTADSTAATGVAWATPSGGSSYVAGKNFVINGGMDIWQRGTTGLGTSTGSYTADRWVLGSSSTTVTRDADVPTSPYFQYSMKMVGTSDNSIIQRVEAANSTLLAGQTVTFSFYAKRTSGAGALDVRFYYPSATDNFASVTQIGSTAVVSASPSSSWTRYSVTAAIGTNITTGLQILINNTGASTTFLTGAQLEIASSASNFSRNCSTIALELAACQRYYYKDTKAVLRADQVIAGSIVYGVYYLPQEMRTTPTLTQTGGATETSNTSATTFSNDGSSSNTRKTGIYVTGGASTGTVYIYRSAEWSAEL